MFFYRMKEIIVSDLLSRNWEKFLEIQAIGDWNGIWTRRGANGELVERFNGVRSYVIYPDREGVVQKNHYRYEDGSSESRTFTPYKKERLVALILENAWTMQYQSKIEQGKTYFFEINFKYESLSVSGACKYLEDGSLNYVTSIWETLDSFRGEPKNIEYTSFNNWKGTKISTITSDLTITISKDCPWKPIHELAPDNLVINFFNGLTVSLPATTVYDQEFLIVTDWLVNPNLIKRGIRYYHLGASFSHFSVMTFTR